MKPAEQIKEKLDIVEVLSQYIQVTKSGSTFKARCPFHGEKTPSFIISPTRQSYHCFGCGEHGDIFTFVEKMEGVDFKGALTLLAEKAGVTLTYTKESGITKDAKDMLLDTLHEATHFYVRERLKHPEITTYLLKRGLSQESIDAFSIGFAPQEWRQLYDTLKSTHKDADIENAGLTIRGDKGYYDRFRSRIMFPLKDSVGRVIGFSGRIWQGDEQSAKYINTPETPLFHKSRFLYGFDSAKTAIRKLNFTLLVEGQMDLISAHQVGFKNAVALSGTALTEEHITLLGRISKNIVIALDADKAGITAALKSARIALMHGFDVKVARFTDGKDASAIVETGGGDALKLVVKHAQHIIDFVLDILSEKSKNDSRLYVRLIEQELLPLIAIMQSPIEREHVLKTVSSRSGISQESLLASLNKVRIADAVPAAQQVETPQQERPVQNTRAFFVVLLQMYARTHPTEALRLQEELTNLGIDTHVADDAALVIEHDIETQLEEKHYVARLGELFVLVQKEHYANAIRVAQAEMQAATQSGDEALQITTLARIDVLQKKMAQLHEERGKNTK